MKDDIYIEFSSVGEFVNLVTCNAYSIFLFY